jgi:branched-chain amino acid transport system ATP-binding protein
MADPLQVSGLSLSFGGLQVLNDVSFSLAKGAVVGIIGPNGAGKTSLLNCINGAYRPQSGSIAFDGESLLEKRPSSIAKIGVARTFQAVQLIPGLSVMENVLLGRHIRQSRNLFAALMYWGPGKSVERQQRWEVGRILELLGLSALADREAVTLPYGQQRLVELARVMASEPRLLLLDEPTSGMSRAERAEIGSIIRSLADGGLSQLIVEHDVGFISNLCDEVIVLNFGRIIAQGTPSTVLQEEHVVEAYIGSRVRSEQDRSDHEEVPDMSVEKGEALRTIPLAIGRDAADGRRHDCAAQRRGAEVRSRKEEQ